MELLVKIVIVPVILTCVVAQLQHYHHASSSEKPKNLTDLNEDRAARMKKYIVDCTIETNVDPNYILQLRSGKWMKALKKQPPLLKKWCLCLLVKTKMMSPDGVLRQDVVMAYVPEKDRRKVEDTIDKCLYQKSHSPADIAWHYVICFRKNFLKYSVI